MAEEKRRSIAQLGRDFRIPFSRIYNALSAVGHESGDVDAATTNKIVVELQQAAIPFSALYSEYGEITLKELAELELNLITEKHKELWNKRSTTSKSSGPNIVDFTGIKHD